MFILVTLKGANMTTIQVYELLPYQTILMLGAYTVGTFWVILWIIKGGMDK